MKVNPAVAIVAVIVGAKLAGILGALLAIPAAASLGVILDELVLSGPPKAPPTLSPSRGRLGLRLSAPQQARHAPRWRSWRSIALRIFWSR